MKGTTLDAEQNTATNILERELKNLATFLENTDGRHSCSSPTARTGKDQPASRDGGCEPPEKRTTPSPAGDDVSQGPE